MKSINNISFLILLITFSNIIDCAFLKSKEESNTNNLSNSLNKREKKQVFNEDLVGTTDKNGTYSYQKKGGEGENWQLEAMRQSRIEEMTEEATKKIQNLPKDKSWILFVLDMAKKIRILKQNKNATNDDWELLAYEEKLRTLKLRKFKDAKGTGGNCEKLARRIMKRVVLLANAKNVKEDSFEKINLTLMSQAKTCGKKKKKIIKPKNNKISTYYEPNCKNKKASYY